MKFHGRKVCEPIHSGEQMFLAVAVPGNETSREWSKSSKERIGLGVKRLGTGTEMSSEYVKC